MSDSNDEAVTVPIAVLLLNIELGKQSFCIWFFYWKLIRSLNPKCFRLRTIYLFSLQLLS